MYIDHVRNAWLQTTLTGLKNKVQTFGGALFKKRDIEPDPGGMRDEMEREYFSRVSRYPR